jgi:hypothetical protein
MARTAASAFRWVALARSIRRMSNEGCDRGGRFDEAGRAEGGAACARLALEVIGGHRRERRRRATHVGVFSQAGEEGDILADHAEAGRAYDAPYHGPDILKSGEMSMVNKDMDLMERKYCDRIELRRWADALIEAAGGQQW